MAIKRDIWKLPWNVTEGLECVCVGGGGGGGRSANQQSIKLVSLFLFLTERRVGVSSGWINWWDVSFPVFPVFLLGVRGPSSWKILQTKNTGEAICGHFPMQLKSYDYLI